MVTVCRLRERLLEDLFVIEFIKEAAFSLAIGPLVLIAAIAIICAMVALVFFVMSIVSVVVGEVKAKIQFNKAIREMEPDTGGEDSDWDSFKVFCFIMIMGGIGAIIGKLLS